MEWKVREIENVLKTIEKKLINKNLNEINRNDLEKMYDVYGNNTESNNHSKNSFVALIYNIIAILTEEQYGLSGYSKKLEKLVLSSNIKYSQDTELFYTDSAELFEDIDHSTIEEKLEDQKIIVGEGYEDFYTRRIIPIYNTIDIESFINSYKKGKYNLDPGFQRNKIWPNDKKEKLIDSIFSSIPIPQIYCYELRDQNIEIVDGKQRLYAIIDFYKNQFKLSKKFAFLEMQNKTFDQLSEIQKNIFLNFSLNFMKIPFNNDEDIKYKVFDRLNSNSVILNFQELRNSVLRSKLNDRVKIFAQENKMVNIFLPYKKSKRMQNIEMLYRFLALKEKIFLEEEKIQLLNHNGIRNTIDEYMKKWTNVTDEEKIKVEIEKIEESFNLSFKIFGHNAFKSYDTTNMKWKNSVNRPLMDAVLINSFLILKNNEAEKICLEKENIVNGLEYLFKEDEEFIDSFLSATGNTKSIELKLNKIFGLYHGNIK